MVERHSDHLKLEVRKRKLLEVLSAEEEALFNMQNVLDQRLKRLVMEEQILLNVLESNVNSNPALNEASRTSSLLQSYNCKSYSEFFTLINQVYSKGDSLLVPLRDHTGQTEIELEATSEADPAHSEKLSNSDPNTHSPEAEDVSVDIGLMDYLDDL